MEIKMSLSEAVTLLELAEKTRSEVIEKLAALPVHEMSMRLELKKKLDFTSGQISILLLIIQ